MMLPTESTTLVNAWIRLQRSDRNSQGYEADFWAHQKLCRLARDAPQECWFVVLAIFAEAVEDEWVLENLAAGPLEDLLSNHGHQFIGAVEDEARRSPVFRQVVRWVWQNDMPEEIWRRVEAAGNETGPASSPPPNPPPSRGRA